MNKPRVEIRDVTPEWALSILEKHDKSLVEGTFRQRNVNPRTVAAYAQDMRAGNWGLNGQGLTFDTEGNLLDGQHRLHAVFKSKATVKMLVLWDVDPQVNKRVHTINTLDAGKKRDLASQLKIEGKSEYFNLASAVRCLSMLSGHAGRQPFTPAQGVSVYSLMEPHVDKIFGILSHNASRRKYSGAVVAPLALFRSVDRDTSELFATELHEMTGLTKTSPVLLFSYYLDRNYIGSRGTDVQWNIMTCLSSALWLYANEKRQDTLRGNKEHLEWLLKTCKQTVDKIREVSGMELTMEELEQKG